MTAAIASASRRISTVWRRLPIAQHLWSASLRMFRHSYLNASTGATDAAFLAGIVPENRSIPPINADSPDLSSEN
jgi:hypothetical protein